MVCLGDVMLILNTDWNRDITSDVILFLTDSQRLLLGHQFWPEVHEHKLWGIYNMRLYITSAS